MGGRAAQPTRSTSTTRLMADGPKASIHSMLMANGARVVRGKKAELPSQRPADWLLAICGFQTRGSTNGEAAVFFQHAGGSWRHCHSVRQPSHP